MRVVALEEHFTAPDLVRRIDPEAHQAPRLPAEDGAPGGPNPLELAARDRRAAVAIDG